MIERTHLVLLFDLSVPLLGARHDRRVIESVQ